MTVTFPSEEWIERYCEKINENEEYKDLASDWADGYNGDFIFVVDSDEDLDDTYSFFLGLEAGECTGAYEVESPDSESHGFVFRGPYSSWIELIEGDVGAIDGIMSGKFALDGDMSQVLEHNESAQVLVSTASEIDTEFKA